MAKPDDRAVVGIPVPPTAVTPGTGGRLTVTTVPAVTYRRC